MRKLINNELRLLISATRNFGHEYSGWFLVFIFPLSREYSELTSGQLAGRNRALRVAYKDGGKGKGQTIT
jgi:hypothetical protein